MHLNFKIIVLLIFVLSGCDSDYVDFSGFFSSKSDVDSRFDDKDNLNEVNPPEIFDVNNFSFLVITDTHYYQNNPEYLKNISNDIKFKDISFLIICGDIVQSGLKKQYSYLREDMTNLSIPIYFVIGNHDLYNDGYIVYREEIGRTIYDFKIGDNHFIFIDTANGTLGKKQKKWLEDTLKKSDSKNKFIFSHYSPFDNEIQTPTAMSYSNDIYYLINLLENNSVSFHISGHLHFFDRRVVRGVKYIILNDQADIKDKYLKISVVEDTVIENIY